MIKKILLFTLLVSQTSIVSADDTQRVAYPDGQFTIYRLSLKDKSGTAFNLRHSEKFLSAKAIQRRKKQLLPIDSTDLPLSRKYITAVNRTPGAQVIGGSKWNNTLLVKTSVSQDIQPLRQLPFVTGIVKVFSTPDSIPFYQPDPVVTDTLNHKKRAKNRYGAGASQIALLNGQPLHDAGFKGQGMLVAIIDGGFMNVDKIGYFKNAKIVGTKDCVYPYNTNLYDELDHGTMVLSDMASNTDSVFVGTAPEASYILIRSEDGRTENLIEEDYWAQAVEYADSIGADVINSSLGYYKFDDKDACHQYRDQDGRTTLNSRTASRIASKGMILVNSAGNEGRKSWKRINCPADATDILAVAALTSDSINAQFSSVGPSADGRVKPDISSQGVRSTVIEGRGVITHANGTSFAAPIACGMVTCLWQALPEKTALEIMDLVRRSADRYEYPDNIYGYGIPNFWKAYQMGKTK